MKLIIGDKNVSSWSMRAWLTAVESGLAFQEILIPLDRPETSQEILNYSRAGKVPCLIDGDLVVSDSLAICEYLAEKAPLRSLWPKDQRDRALARSYVAEMHSSFAGMRNQLSMDLRLKMEIRHLNSQTISDIKRVIEIWMAALAKGRGPFLFGDFGIVDAFFAPVVFRFLSYGIPIESPSIREYMKQIQARESVKAWYDAGVVEMPVTYKF